MTLIIIGSQAVKNTCTVSVGSKDFSFYKATNGIKRHLAVDMLGFPFFTHCAKANVSDDVRLIKMLSLNTDYFKSKPVSIPKITILLEHGYHIDFLIAELKQVYPLNYDKNPVSIVHQTLQAREGNTGKNWICASGCSLGD